MLRDTVSSPTLMTDLLKKVNETESQNGCGRRTCHLEAL